MNDEDETTLLGEVNVDFVRRRVWLVKLPEFLADEWKAKGPDQDLGKVQVTQNQITIVTQSGEHLIPSQYVIQLQQPTPDNPMHIFSETPDGVLSMEGTVEYKGLAKPVDLNPEYRSLCKDRVVKANVKTRVVKALDNAPTTRRPIDTLFNKKKKEERKPRADERLEKDVLTERIFRAFETSNYLTIKSLQETTNQPVQWLKEVLADICIYNKRGPNKTKYELKPEYKKKKKE